MVKTSDACQSHTLHNSAICKLCHSEKYTKTVTNSSTIFYYQYSVVLMALWLSGIQECRDNFGARTRGTNISYMTDIPYYLFFLHTMWLGMHFKCAELTTLTSSVVTSLWTRTQLGLMPLQKILIFATEDWGGWFASWIFLWTPRSIPRSCHLFVLLLTMSPWLLLLTWTWYFLMMM